jgi:NADH-quinone oxidoreductase subunit A
VNGISINALAAGVLILASLGMGIGMIVFSHWLGRHKSNPRKIAPYESGMPLLDESRKRLSVKFFIVGLVFLLFDVEMAFLYPFALIRGFAKPFMFVELGVFFLMMTATYIYLLKEHAFRWEN